MTTTQTTETLTANIPTFAACELTTRTTLTRRGYSTITLGAGCVVAWTPGNVPGTIDVEHFSHTATISQDDAIPMEWDAQDQMWVRA